MAGIIARAGASEAGTLSGSSPIDPYEIAYLRGGAREVLKLRLFELMQLGYLIVTEKKRWFDTDRWLTVAPDAPDRHHLSHADKYLLACYETPRAAKEVFSFAFHPEMESACREFRHGLLQRGLLQGQLAPESKANKRILGGIFLLAFLGSFAAYALFTSLFVAFFATVIGGVILHTALGYRPTAAGKAYLKALEGQYADYKRFDGAIWQRTPSATQVTAVAVFGFAILQGSAADSFATLLGAQAQGSVTYSVESGGGCGGGCGGCGGCGG